MFNKWKAAGQSVPVEEDIKGFEHLFAGQDIPAKLDDAKKRYVVWLVHEHRAERLYDALFFPPSYREPLIPSYLGS